MSNHAEELSDFICQFLTLVYATPKSRRKFKKDADEMGATLEQYAAMSLAQLLTDKYRLTAVEELN